MNPITHIEADGFACVDCVQMIANGDAAPNTPPARVMEIAKATARWCLDDIENKKDFSTTPCVCCNSKLAGSRHHVEKFANPRELIVINEYGRPLKAYDDGVGKLFILRDSLHTLGIVRAYSWEDAYGIAEDELFQEANEKTYQEMAKECDHIGPFEDLYENAIWQENYGFRPNGPNATDEHGHGIYRKDLNGERFDELTQELVKELHLTIVLPVDDIDDQDQLERWAKERAEALTVTW